MPTRIPSASSRPRRAVWVTIRLAVAMRALRNRRLQETVLTWVIGLAALARLAGENQNRVVARLAAWDKRLSQRYRSQARQ